MQALFALICDADAGLTASAKATAVRRFDFAEATSNPPKL